MRLLSALMLIIVLAGCSADKSGGQAIPPGGARVPPSASEAVTAPSRVLSEELIVSGIHLGSTMTEVEKLLGKPDRVENYPQQALQAWIYPAEGLRVWLPSKYQLVYTLQITAPSAVRTRQGIGIGDSVEDVERAYGPSETKEYRFPDDVSLWFQITDNKVSLISLSWRDR